MKNRRFYQIGGIAAIVVALGSVSDIGISMISGAGDLSLLPGNAMERFAQLAENPWLGLYNLDFLNLITTLIMIPATLALCFLLWESCKETVAFGGVISLIGTVVFIVNNPALPMLDLSKRYVAITGASDQNAIIGAGEAILAHGAHGSMGVFLGFFLPLLGGLFLSWAVFRSGIFRKALGVLGLLGNSGLLVYLVLVTFFPEMQSFALALAAPGGILSILWLLGIGVRLWKVR